MTKLRSKGTLVHAATRWTSLKDLRHRPSHLEIAKPTCRPRFPRPRDITASLRPLSDVAFWSHLQHSGTDEQLSIILILSCLSFLRTRFISYGYKLPSLFN
jgi:hypothetical protein